MNEINLRQQIASASTAIRKNVVKKLQYQQFSARQFTVLPKKFRPPSRQVISSRKLNVKRENIKSSQKQSRDTDINMSKLQFKNGLFRERSILKSRGVRKRQQLKTTFHTSDRFFQSEKYKQLNSQVRQIAKISLKQDQLINQQVGLALIQPDPIAFLESRKVLLQKQNQLLDRFFQKMKKDKNYKINTQRIYEMIQVRNVSKSRLEMIKQKLFKLQAASQEQFNSQNQFQVQRQDIVSKLRQKQKLYSQIIQKIDSLFNFRSKEEACLMTLQPIRIAFKKSQYKNKNVKPQKKNKLKIKLSMQSILNNQPKKVIQTPNEKKQKPINEKSKAEDQQQIKQMQSQQMSQSQNQPNLSFQVQLKPQVKREQMERQSKLSLSVSKDDQQNYHIKIQSQRSQQSFEPQPKPAQNYQNNKKTSENHLILPQKDQRNSYKVSQPKNQTIASKEIQSSQENSGSNQQSIKFKKNQKSQSQLKYNHPKNWTQKSKPFIYRLKNTKLIASNLKKSFLQKNDKQKKDLNPNKQQQKKQIQYIVQNLKHFVVSSRLTPDSLQDYLKRELKRILGLKQFNQKKGSLMDVIQQIAKCLNQQDVTDIKFIKQQKLKKKKPAKFYNFRSIVQQNLYKQLHKIFMISGLHRQNKNNFLMLEIPDDQDIVLASNEQKNQNSHEHLENDLKLSQKLRLQCFQQQGQLIQFGKKIVRLIQQQHISQLQQRTIIEEKIYDVVQTLILALKNVVDKYIKSGNHDF